MADVDSRSAGEVTTPAPKCCSRCGKRLELANVSGLCRPHLIEYRREEAERTEVGIADALAAGHSHGRIVADLGVPPYRVQIVSATFVREPRRRVNDIIDAAAAVFGYSRDEITGHCRSQVYVPARHAVCLLGMEAGHSSTAVGRLLGNRNHTTVLHGRDKARAREQESAEYAAKVEATRAMKIEEEGAFEAAEAVGAQDPIRVRTMKPKNDFFADDDDDGDGSHAFHRGIAAGSRRLRQAILAAKHDAAWAALKAARRA